MGESENLKAGLYETVIDASLLREIQLLGDRAVTGAVDKADFPYVLAHYLGKRLESSFERQSAKERIALANEVLRAINRFDQLDTSAEPLIIEKEKAKVLQEVKHRAHQQKTLRPLTPLNDSALLTNTGHDPSLQVELSHEFESADRVDAIIAFIKKTGIRTIEKQLARLKARNVPIRIITTTYTGTTERETLDQLVREYGATVKINYNSRTTRLHAKAWLIHRDTGFDTAFVGSSNLSASAFVSGLEWNVRLSKSTTPAVFKKFESTFDGYWGSPSFETYDPDRDADRLDQALEDARGRRSQSDRDYDFTALDIRPYPYQQVMLDELEYEREHGRHQNLVVAATGTGKTVVAALDYKRLIDRLESELQRRPRTLFVAHRDEILDQSARTFRDVIKSGKIVWSTSEGYRLSTLTEARMADFDNIAFASIQSLHGEALENFAPDFFDVIIIDEFHHAEAKSYRRLMDHFEPIELVGLTATPERGDGINVAQEFFGGRVATELRLWDALEEQLLSPFHYFVNYDGTDLSSVEMRGGDYVTSELSNVLTGNDARVNLIVQAMRDKIPDLNSMRALCFCVDIKHAKYMSKSFNKYGLKAEYVTSRESSMERDEALKALKNGRIQILCSVDIFNEGVDVPAVDTVLMLRPTQSSTIFLQQLGRGLRPAEGKTVLTVLDFVGNQNKNFRFDGKLHALTGTSRRELQKAVENGFGYLPAGCQIVLEEKTQQIVLQSIKDNLNITTNKLPAEIRRTATATSVDSILDYQLIDYLDDSSRELAGIYGRSPYGKRPVSWKRLLHWAATGTDTQPDELEDVRRRFKALCRVADRERVDAYTRLLVTPNLRYETMSPFDKVYAHMLMYTIWPQGKRNDEQLPSVDFALDVLRSDPEVVDEIRQIFNAVQVRNKHLFTKPEGPLGLTPLRVGADYTREELLAALGQGYEFNDQAPGGVREGVKYCHRTNTDALLVTLVKSEADFSPNTLYRDYAINETLFHWESQSTTGPDSKAGRRYQGLTDTPSNIALFIREAKTNEFGGGAAYTFAGPAHFLETRGSRPMQVTWELEHPLPPELYLAARAVSS